MQCHTQAKIITINLTVELYFTLPELSTTKIVTCNCHVDDSTKGRYDMILGRNILTNLGLNIKCSYPIIEAYYGPFKGSTAPMVDLVMYEFKYLNTGKFSPEKFFMNAYTKEIHESEQFG